MAQAKKPIARTVAVKNRVLAMSQKTCLADNKLIKAQGAKSTFAEFYLSEFCSKVQC